MRVRLLPCVWAIVLIALGCPSAVVAQSCDSTSVVDSLRVELLAPLENPPTVLRLILSTGTGGYNGIREQGDGLTYGLRLDSRTTADSLRVIPTLLGHRLEEVRRAVHPQMPPCVVTVTYQPTRVWQAKVTYDPRNADGFRVAYNDAFVPRDWVSPELDWEEEAKFNLKLGALRIPFNFRAPEVADSELAYNETQIKKKVRDHTSGLSYAVRLKAQKETNLTALVFSATTGR